MDSPPLRSTPDAGSVPAARWARAFWITAIVVAVVLLLLALRRDRIPVFQVQRTDSPLAFYASADTCGQGARVTVVERATTVTVTVTHNRQIFGATGMCAERVPLALDQPLGERTVMDGDRNVAVPVGSRDPDLPTPDVGG